MPAQPASGRSSARRGEWQPAPRHAQSQVRLEPPRPVAPQSTSRRPRDRSAQRPLHAAWIRVSPTRLAVPLATAVAADDDGPLLQDSRVTVLAAEGIPGLSVRSTMDNVRSPRIPVRMPHPLILGRRREPRRRIGPLAVGQAAPGGPYSSILRAWHQPAPPVRTPQDHAAAPGNGGRVLGQDQAKGLGWQ